MKHKPTKIKKAYLIASLAVLILGFFLTLFLANVEAAEFEEEQRNAMERMERAEAYIKERIIEKGIEIEEISVVVENELYADKAVKEAEERMQHTLCISWKLWS